MDVWLQGVPGFSVVVARVEKLLQASQWSPRSFTLDLVAQYKGLNATGMRRSCRWRRQPTPEPARFFFFFAKGKGAETSQKFRNVEH